MKRYHEEGIFNLICAIAEKRREAYVRALRTFGPEHYRTKACEEKLRQPPLNLFDEEIQTIRHKAERGEYEIF